MKTMNNPALTVFAVIFAVALFVGFSLPNDSIGPRDRAPTGATGSYASVNGLKMYYEIHGTGKPLVLLHGALTTIDTSFGKVLPALAKTRQVVAVEQQGHGRTADMDRPLTYQQMADDTAALLHQLNIENADFFGYSMGSGIALQIAIRHPDLGAQTCARRARVQQRGVSPRDVRANREHEARGLGRITLESGLRQDRAESGTLAYADRQGEATGSGV